MSCRFFKEAGNLLFKNVHPTFLNSKIYDDFLTRGCAIHLEMPSQTSSALQLVKASKTFKDLERSESSEVITKLEEAIFTKLESKQFSESKSKIIQSFEFDSIQLLELLDFLKNSVNKKGMRVLLSFEQKLLESCLKKVSHREDGSYWISYGKKRSNLDLAQKRNFKKLKENAGVTGQLNVEEAVELLSKNKGKVVVFPEQGCSRKELSKCIASLLNLSQMCLGYHLEALYFSQKSDEKRKRYTGLFLKQVCDLPERVKGYFLAEKEQIIENSTLSDEELWAIICLVQEPKNLRALEMWQDLAMAEIIERLEYLNPDKRGVKIGITKEFESVKTEVLTEDIRISNLRIEAMQREFAAQVLENSPLQAEIAKKAKKS